MPRPSAAAAPAAAAVTAQTAQSAHHMASVQVVAQVQVDLFVNKQYGMWTVQELRLECAQRQMCFRDFEIFPLRSGENIRFKDL